MLQEDWSGRGEYSPNLVAAEVTRRRQFKADESPPAPWTAAARSASRHSLLFQSASRTVRSANRQKCCSIFRRRFSHERLLGHERLLPSESAVAAVLCRRSPKPRGTAHGSWEAATIPESRMETMNRADWVGRVAPRAPPGDLQGRNGTRGATRPTFRVHGKELKPP
jgi:hypothetical protein